MARQTASPTSDLDLAFLLEQEGTSSPNPVRAVIQETLAVMGHSVRFHCFLSGPTKLVLFLGDSYTKVDLFLAQDLAEFAVYLPWDLPAERMILLDKQGTIPREIASSQPLSSSNANGTAAATAENLADQFNAEVDKVLYAFEAASLNCARRDHYRFYFEYNIALHRLVRLICIARGFPSETFLPPNLFARMLSPLERVEFQALQGQMDLRDAGPLLRRFVAFLHSLLVQTQGRIPLQHALPAIQEFCANILRRDFPPQSQK